MKTGKKITGSWQEDEMVLQSQCVRQFSYLGLPETARRVVKTASAKHTANNTACL